MNIDMFGPTTRAEVRIDSTGKVQDIRISHPNRRNDIMIPPDWAADITGTLGEIARDVSDALGGAQVKIVRLLPIEEA